MFLPVGYPRAVHGSPAPSHILVVFLRGKALNPPSTSVSIEQAHVSLQGHLAETQHSATPLSLTK